MKLTRISKDGRGFLLHLDELEGGVKIYHPHTIADFKIRKDIELTEEQIEEIKAYDLKQYLRSRVMGYVSRRERSKKEIETYVNDLIRKYKIQTSEDLIFTVLKELEADEIISDERFANWWVDNRIRNRNSGVKLLELELLQKGIDRGTIQSVLVKIEPEVMQNKCDELAQRKFTTLKGADRFVRINKLKAYLARRGFDWNQINLSVDKLGQN